MKIIVYLLFFVAACTLELTPINALSVRDRFHRSRHLLPIPYIIYRTPPGAGFWSNFFVVFASIDRADKEGWIPVVDMERYPNAYNEQVPIHGTTNSWEYFFEQPGGMSLASAIFNMNAVDNAGFRDGAFITEISIKPSEQSISRAKYLIKKYIKIKNYIMDEVNTYIPAGLHENILGIHVRGTDRRKGAANHMLTADDVKYLEKAKELDKIHNFEKIFLACDEPETLDMFLMEFGDRLIFTDAYRVSASLLAEDKEDWLFNNPRPLHRYHLAKEVLIDALLLARSGHLLCGHSNVSRAAIFFADGDPVIHEVASPGLFQPTQ